MRLRPVVDPRYVQALIRMGLRHGKMWDCGNEQCPVCKEYRIVEKEEYDKLNEEEKSELGNPRFTLVPHTENRANSRASNSRPARRESGDSDDKDWLTFDR